jgi:archaellum biogenesis ATPase FlaH
MTTLRPYATTRKTDLQWYYPNLLPIGELVLLDADAGVGKTYITSALASLLSYGPMAQTSGSILCANTEEQDEMLAEQLVWQNPRFDSIRRLCLDDLPKEGNPLDTLVPFLEEHIKACSTKLLLLDGLESFLNERFESDTKQKQPNITQYQIFWRKLRDLALAHKCTIIVTRRDGLHQSRSYGPYTKAGTTTARIIFTLKWHPINPDCRILTLAKCTRGKVGTQFHFSFGDDGMAHFGVAEPHGMLKPATAVSPWLPDPSYTDPLADPIYLIESALQGGPVPMQTLLHEASRLYSKTRIKQALAKLKLPESFEDGRILLHPTTQMLKRFRRANPVIETTDAEIAKTPVIQPSPARTRGEVCPLATKTRDLPITQKPMATTSLSKAG